MARLAGAAFHIVLLFAGPAWIDFAGAPESVVQSARDGTGQAPVSILVIAAILASWGWAALAVNGRVRSFPLARTLVFIVAAIFIVRGLLVVPLAFAADWSNLFQVFHVAASLFILSLGMAYAFGWWGTRTAQ